MKGTLFSADFVKDSNDNLRLLELNTDTTVPDYNYKFFDYTDFISLLNTNDISKITVIYKPSIQKDFVNHISESLNVSASFITSFTHIEEGANVIYPTSVDDAVDTFILRMAYDESAIFDSEYAKDTLNVLKLYSDYNEPQMVCEFYHSSSNEGVYNTFTSSSLNAVNLPDVVYKNISENHKSAKFYKIGSEVENESIEERYNQFINTTNDSNIIIEKYHVDTEIVTENKVSSIRTFSIIYGPNLDLVHLANYKAFSPLEVPTTINYNSNSYVNELDSKHYYEFATNIVKYQGTFDGILNRHLIIKSDDTQVEAGNIQVGDSLKSYYIASSSLNENEFNYLNWEINGNSFPTGSYLTSSLVVYKNTKDLENKTLINLQVNNNEDTIFVAHNKSFLVYDSDLNKITWKTALNVKVETDYLIDYDGSTAQVTANELFITSEDNLSLVEIDVEDTDTYIIGGTTPINSFVTHNAPCFVKGTKITLADGSLKNIEDIVPGDIVSTFDLINNEIKHNIVNAVYSKKVNQIVEYIFDNGENIKCTIDHPIYVETKGWCSHVPYISNNSYSLESSVTQIEVGDTIKLFNGTTKLVNIILSDEEVVVYNLQDIEGNHNFFANNILVHNRFCFVEGTEITLENGEIKKIEDIEVGDIVLSFNEEKNINEYNKVTNIYKPNHDDLVEYKLSNGKSIISTFDHPYYVNGLNLASYSPELTIQRYENLNNVIGIKVGDELNLENYEKVTILSIIEKDKIMTQTYIFTVENAHNFYANGVLVHNKGCFIAGTQIKLPNDETKNIEDVVIGDSILTFNETTQTTEPGIVGDLKQHEVENVIRITFTDNTNITTTSEHPFYIKDKGWVEAGNLVNSDVCKKSDGSELEILWIEGIVGKTMVYNLLDVSENHNFFANEVLVHNKL